MSDRKAAEEYLHLRDWFDRAAMVVTAGRAAYDGDELLQEAGDSLMRKIGEPANGLSKAGVEPPEGISWNQAVANRNWLIHQYDAVDRDLTWSTLTLDLPVWRQALAARFIDAECTLTDDI